jgi:hypothetical protein
MLPSVSFVLSVLSIVVPVSRRQGQIPIPGLFAGAACCRPIQLPSYKAAPLQTLGGAIQGVRGDAERRDFPEKMLALY